MLTVGEGTGEGALAVVLAGGLGTRFGSSRPKQLAKLNGKTVLSHTLARLSVNGLFSTCVIVANLDWYDEIQDAIEESLIDVETVLVAGGANRNESVWNAIEAVDASDETKCIVHDGVRPLVSEKLVRGVLDALDYGDSVIPIIDSVDPLVRVVDGRVTTIESREAVFRGQSPQGFRLGALRHAFNTVGLDKLGQYSTIYEILRLADSEAEILTINGDLNNIKITLPLDRIVATELLSKDEQ